MKNLHKHFQSLRRCLFPWKSQWPLGPCFGIAHLQMGGYQLSWGRSLWLTGVLPRFLPKFCQVGHLLSLDSKADLVFINGSFYLQTVMYPRFQYLNKLISIHSSFWKSREQEPLKHITFINPNHWVANQMQFLSRSVRTIVLWFLSKEWVVRNVLCARWAGTVYCACCSPRLLSWKQICCWTKRMKWRTNCALEGTRIGKVGLEWKPPFGNVLMGTVDKAWSHRKEGWREEWLVSKPLLNAMLNHAEFLQAILFSNDFPIGGDEDSWAFFGNDKSVWW